MYSCQKSIHIIMANEEEIKVEETLDDPEPILDESGQDTFDWKAETFKRHGMAKRYKTDLQKLKTDFEEYKTKHPDKPIEEPKPQDKKDFDLAEKSYLLASGIKKEQIPLVLEEMQKSGKSIDEILESPYFKEKLEMEAS